ncbi:MAG TPA: multiheme c-type cytochrome [Planctomycetaceae bacterium]|nr:multiheme c-type cytochrome [Planctomycetaceae bacterium]
MSPRIVVLGAAVLALCAVAAYLLWRDSPPPRSVEQNHPTTMDSAEPAPPADDRQVSPAEDSAPEKKSADEPPRRVWDKHKGEKFTAKPLLDGWPVPAAAFVLSGEMHGYVEPCGCSLHQLGGISRRADLLRQIKAREWPVTALDTGGLVSNPGRNQAKIKLEMALRALRDMEYAGVALGVEELLTGIDLLRFNAEERPPFLSCNLVLFGGGVGLEVPTAIVKVGQLKIGVTAVFGESLKAKVVPPGGDNGGGPPNVEVLDPAASLTKTLPALEAEKPDLLVLISHSKMEETRELAAKFPQFQLIVSAGGSEDPDPRPQIIDKTLLVAPGQKGKHVAVVGYYPDDAGQKFRYEVVALDDQRFQETPAMREHMRHYQEALAVQDLVAGEPPIEDPRNALLTVENPFVGAKVCGECHTRAYEKMMKTKHAQATQSIKTGRPGQEATYISRIHDPECVACHVTGWDPGRGEPKDYYRYKTGFTGEASTPHLLGQQCENCHGPGGRHVELERQFRKDGKETEELTKFRDFVQLSVADAGQKSCVKCHDGDNDPHFKTDGEPFDWYWSEIQHPWRD